MHIATSTYIILFFFFLSLSAFISALEVAFLAVQKSRLRYLVQSGASRAPEVEKILQKPERFLATVLFSNNIVQAAAAAVGTIVAVNMLGEAAGVIAATIGIALATLLLAEAIPKTFAARNAERLSLLFARPFRILESSLLPVVSAISWLTNKVTGSSLTASYQASEDEIRSMIAAWKAEGSVEQSEAEMMEKIFNFGDRSVRTLMTPRTEIVWLENNITFGEFLKTYSEHPHSRFPVYDDNVENVKGMISIKDVLMAQANGDINPDTSLENIIRPVYFTPENKPIGELFNEMQSRGIQMAIVVDEYGGIDGIATIQELVEEIVGEISDELAKGSADYETIDEKTYQVDGSMRIDEVNERLGLKLPEGEDYESVAGLILVLLGRIPKEGEQIRYSGLKMAITEMRNLKIEKVLISKE
ncbi:MAG: hemolysin family protein [Dehalococcoidia bacterium]|nr:hemolysin family protein [Dehalococcoidia bacterium]